MARSQNVSMSPPLDTFRFSTPQIHKPSAVILRTPKDLSVKSYPTYASARVRRATHTPKLDPTRTHPYNRNFTVIHFFDLMNFSTGPSAPRWPALFLAAPHSLEMRLE